MNTEQQFFIKILRDFIGKEKTKSNSKNLNLDLLSSYAKKHEVQAILYYQTKDRNYLSAYSSTLYLNTNRKNMVQKLTDAFNFPYFIVKGSSIAEIYPVPELRTMGDIDLVVHTEDRERVHDILTSQGYMCTSKFADREWQYYKNNMELELHDHLVYAEAVNNPKQEAFFNDFWPYVNNNTLDWNFHFLFLISHLRKHFMNEGVGFRQFMDIAVVARYCDLDWQWIEEKAAAIELLPFLKVVLALCNRWFAINVPMDTPELSDEFYESATNKIFDDGVFGFANEDNFSSAATNEYRKNGTMGRIRRVLRIIFPSYDSLKESPGYHFVNGKPYMVPVAWVYRVFHSWKRITGVTREINKMLASKEQINEREAMYKQWGL